MIKEKNVALVPTFSALRRIIENGDALPARVMERARLVATKHQEGVRAAHKAGVRIATGTDAGTPFNTHERFTLELVYLTEAGLSPTQALVAATSVAADVVGRPKAGRIAADSWADMVFVDGDPLRDGVPVHGAERDGLQDQHVERALGKIGFWRRHDCIPFAST